MLVVKMSKEEFFSNTNISTSVNDILVNSKQTNGYAVTYQNGVRKWIEEGLYIMHHLYHK